MIFSRTALQLVAITSAVHAFAPTAPNSRPLVALEQRSFATPSVVSLASKSDDNESSKTYEYLEDSSVKEPESYLEDMANGSKSSSDDKDETPSSDYLKDMSTEELSTEVSETEETTEAVEEPPSTSEDDDVVMPEASDKTLASLLRIAASTGRGEFARADQKETAAELIATLEANNPTPEPTNSPMINGRWELVYSSTQLFRSSPFFMAGRAVCSTQDQADQYDWFCDMHRKALAISNIGTVRQVISPTLMVSEFEVKVGAVPFLNDFTPFSYSGGLPLTIDGSIVSQADITPTADGKSWELLMDTVQIKGSNIPGLRTILDNGLQLQSRGLGSFLENNLDGYTNPRPIFETTYLSDAIRISRDQDGKIFVYAKEADETTTTDYSKVEADLGVLKLLGGFNDAITKFYI